MTPEIPTVSFTDAHFDRALLNNVPSPRRMVSISTAQAPQRAYENKIICAYSFETLYPHLSLFSKYIESEDFQYLSLHVGEFVLQIMRWQ